MIRRAKMADLPVLARLAAEGDVAWGEQALRGAIESAGTLIWISVGTDTDAGGESGRGSGGGGGSDSRKRSAETEAEAAVGFIVVGWAADTADIQNIVVASACRRRGVGRALVEHVVHWAVAQGVTTISLEVGVSNTAGRRLYQQSGFRDCGVRLRYYANGDDAHVMVLRARSEITYPSGGQLPPIFGRASLEKSST